MIIYKNQIQKKIYNFFDILLDDYDNQTLSYNDLNNTPLFNKINKRFYNYLITEDNLFFALLLVINYNNLFEVEKLTYNLFKKDYKYTLYLNLNNLKNNYQILSDSKKFNNDTLVLKMNEYNIEFPFERILKKQNNE